MINTTHLFDHILLANGWQHDVAVVVDNGGTIVALEAGAQQPTATRVRGAAIPGMINAHGHAFQRAMAGHAEYRAEGRDTFWTWRERMYALALAVTPEDVAAIAAQLYVEMVKAGYTSAVEFHYLHNAPDGQPYDDPMMMSAAIIEAAQAIGIGLTHVPALYMVSDFGGVPPTEGQRRFILSPDNFLRLVESLRQLTAKLPRVKLGLGLHSLRAVPREAMAAVLSAVAAEQDLPIHIHAAEQRREVEACLATLGRRPVEWLLETQHVDASWCLVHATHMTAAEARDLAASGATACLCPTTEGNLGDGFFPLADYLDAAGCFAIGSDSHISISPPEELRWLDYGQRLRAEERNIAATRQQPHTGARLWRAAAAGGAAASGRPVGEIAVGREADIVVLDTDTPLLTGLSDDGLVDALVFSGQPTAVKEVMIGGRWVVSGGRHRREEQVAAKYKQVIARLFST